jgi:hypothetical protein
MDVTKRQVTRERGVTEAFGKTGCGFVISIFVGLMIQEPFHLKRRRRL